MCNACLAAGLSRRAMLGAGSAAVATTPLVGVAQAQPAAPSRRRRRHSRSWSRAMPAMSPDKMNERDFSAGRAARAQGQAPFAAILGCADSRVAPELAFDQPPGELFVVRVAGNFMTPDGLASLEYGAAVLGTKVIMVLGHTSCGAVNATVAALQKGNDLPGHIGDLVRAMKPGIEPALKQPGDDLLSARSSPTCAPTSSACMKQADPGRHGRRPGSSASSAPCTISPRARSRWSKSLPDRQLEPAVRKTTPAPAGRAGCRASCGCGPAPRAAAWCCRPRGRRRPPCPSAPPGARPAPRTSA